MSDIVLSMQSGEPVASSRQIADNFEKRHDHVIKETSIAHSDGHTSINKTPKVTGIGQVYFVNLFLKTEKSKKVED